MADRQIDLRDDGRFLNITSRLARVPSQITDFTTALDEHYALQPTLFTVTFEPGNTNLQLPRPVDVTCPQHAQVIMGEIVHSLRSTLDNLIWSLAFRNCGHEVQHTQFVIADTPESFDHQRARRLSGLTTDQITGVERIQPYNGGTWLSLLAELSNVDKHRHLIELANASDVKIVSTDGTAEDYRQHRGAYVIPESGSCGRAVFIHQAPPQWRLMEKYDPVQTVDALYRHVCYTVMTLEPSINLPVS